MSRSQRTWNADTPYPDGMYFLSATDIFAASGGGTATLTRIASGEWSLRISTATATQVVGPLSTVMLRFGSADDTQNIFGSARAGGSNFQPIGFPNTLSTATVLAGAAISIPVLSSVNFAVGQAILVDTVASGVQEYTYITSIPDGTHLVATLANGHTTPFPIAANVFTTPAGVSGSPPYTGATEFNPVVGPRPKGVLIKQITPRYIINTANLATNTIGLTNTVYANGVAPVVTNVLTNAANGLATAFAATPYVTPIPIPVANQQFTQSRNVDQLIEWDVTNTTGTVDLLGIEVVCSFNYD